MRNILCAFLTMMLLSSFIATAQPVKTFSPSMVGISDDLSFLLSDVVVSTTFNYPTVGVVTKSTNNVVREKNIYFFLKPVTTNAVTTASSTVSAELRYYTQTSASAGTFTYDRPANPLNAKGAATNLPKSRIVYTNTQTGSTKLVRNETPYYTFVCGAYDFMIGKTPSEIAAYCQVENVTFKEGEPRAIAGTGVRFEASAARVAKDVFLLNASPSRLWDKCAMLTTYVTANPNQVHSVFPMFAMQGNTLWNNTFINETFWKDFNLQGKNGFAPNSTTTFTQQTFTYRLKILNDCVYSSMTEAQAILGYGMMGQCGPYYDFYWDSSEQNCEYWNLEQTAGDGRIDRATNTIYYNPSKRSVVMIEATVAPKSNPNAKVVAFDSFIDLKTGQARSDIFTWIDTVQ